MIQKRCCCQGGNSLTSAYIHLLVTTIPNAETSDCAASPGNAGSLLSFWPTYRFYSSDMRPGVSVGEASNRRKAWCRWLGLFVSSTI